MEALSAVFATIKWFADQKETNDGAKQETSALRARVLRMIPVLEPLKNASGLERAQMILDNLQSCLEQAKHIYSKYHVGWKMTKFWVTPAQILEKTLRTTKQISESYQELTLALNVVNHLGGGRDATNSI